MTLVHHYAKSFFASQYFLNHAHNNIILTFSNEEEAVKAYYEILFFTKNVLYFPSFDTIPYDRISVNQNILSERAAILTELASNPCAKNIIITNAINLIAKIPNPSVFSKALLKLSKGTKFSTNELLKFLIENGFSKSPTAIDTGEFAVRGEIIDIVLPKSKAYRINFAWGAIESIKKYDVDTQISKENCDELVLSPASEVILTPDTINNFKNSYLTNFGVNYTKTPLYESILDGRKFASYDNLLPLFYNELSTITDYLSNPVIIYDNLSLQAIIEYENSYNDFYTFRINSNKISVNSFYPALPPKEFCISSDEIKKTLNDPHNVLLNAPILNEEQSNSYYPLAQNNQLKSDIKGYFDLIVNNPKKISIIFYQSKSNLEKLKSIAHNYNHRYIEIDNIQSARIGLINLASAPFNKGFFTNQYIFISEQDLFGEKQTNSSSQSSKRRLKNILTELDNLEEGELIVHKDHGIGKFITVETINVAGNLHDCLKILYADNDRLYIPVENIDSIKKYGNFEAELDKLGGASWQRRRSKLKNRISEIAEQLLQIAAERKLALTNPIEFESHGYDKFCSRFNYSETDDQLRAIEDVKNDLISGNLMDRLICGDVGFGKTEVAMRAAYMVSANIHEKSQIAIIVPTTILCKQHYSRFVERFEGFGLNILQLSRLVKASKVQTIKDQIKNGNANIIVGTHALLAKDIEFNNLKLLIIDEEQHFGVSQKERLKSLKSEVHVLSLSATPIPRTLQMSMVGLKELSLIATPPIDRLTVRTTVMPFDDIIIRDALLKEHFRGGQSFYVCPRIKDILEIEKKLQKIVPELKYKIAHGQMPPATVDEVMSEFCDGKFDVLLSTTIIESGIDIATANTMIIHKADMLGLSQLYQLRGRIGRSKVRGYAYLTLANNRKITNHAINRLEIMQTIDSLGAGFTIANHDMDLRGFGNLVGEEQSGQIREVGVELYQEMLDEQIAKLKNESSIKDDKFVPTINLGLPVFIRDTYISDSSLRLGIYRRIGNLLTPEELESFKDEMIDRFGSIPPELDNLLNIVKIKQLCVNLGIENLDSGERGFVLKFHKQVDVGDMIIRFVNKFPRSAKVRPDNKLLFLDNIGQKNIIIETNNLLSQLMSCRI